MGKENDRGSGRGNLKSLPARGSKSISVRIPSAMEVIREAPSSDAYIPLSTHQSQTPESFYSGPPVLYHHSPSATLQIHASDVAAAPAFSGFAEGAPVNHVNGSAIANGDHEEEEDREISIPNVDIWVTSE